MLNLLLPLLVKVRVESFIYFILCIICVLQHAACLKKCVLFASNRCARFITLGSGAVHSRFEHSPGVYWLSHSTLGSQNRRHPTSRSCLVHFSG
ncbi:hypothetical protein ACOSQ2_018756 [Xanthoceras sorbifolium]